MLRELSVQNLALIEDVCVELHSGFCAWTGETGAGKTLLLEALGLLLGERGSTELAALGRTHQVICVTHLPQVASYAPHQWTIHKLRQGQRITRSAWKN